MARCLLTYRNRIHWSQRLTRPLPSALLLLSDPTLPGPLLYLFLAPFPLTVYRCTDIGIPAAKQHEWYNAHFGSTDGSVFFRAMRCGLRLVAKEVCAIAEAGTAAPLRRVGGGECVRGANPGGFISNTRRRTRAPTLERAGRIGMSSPHGLSKSFLSAGKG